MPDFVRCLKFENDISEIDYLPTEIDEREDIALVNGIAIDENIIIQTKNGEWVMQDNKHGTNQRKISDKNYTIAMSIVLG